MLVNETVLGAVFVTVMVCFLLVLPTNNLAENAIDDCESFRNVPIPVSEITWGLLGSLSVKVNVPVRTPPAVGRNVTVMEHSASEPMDLPQPFDAVKSPVGTTLEIVIVPVPLFVSVMV